MDQQKIILGYWGIRGLAQPLRFLCEYLEIPYEDKRYTSPEEWFNVDTQKEPFKSHPIVNLPYIIDGNEHYYESGALAIYLAHKAKKPELLGSNPKEQVLIAEARGVIQDLMMGFFRVITLPQEEYDTKRKEAFAENVLWLIDRLNRFLDGKTYVGGDNISIVDFHLLEVCETIKHFNAEVLAKFENLANHHARMVDLPKIKEYMASNRFIERPFYPVGPRFRWG